MCEVNGCRLIEETFRGALRYKVQCDGMGKDRSGHTIGYVKRRFANRPNSRWVFVHRCRRSDTLFKTRKQAVDALVQACKQAA